MFSNVLDKSSQMMLSRILENNLIPSSYLAGGTALAMQIGHRFSYAFDFFTHVKFDAEQLAADLMSIGNLKTLYVKKSTFHGILDSINISWLYYPNPLLVRNLLRQGLILGSRQVPENAYGRWFIARI